MIQTSSKKYDDIFVEQKESGIIESVESKSILADCHYIAHHPVFKEGKKTSNLTIVFDASAKENGPSLYEFLCKGSQLTLLSILKQLIKLTRILICCWMRNLFVRKFIENVVLVDESYINSYSSYCDYSGVFLVVRLFEISGK